MLNDILLLRNIDLFLVNIIFNIYIIKIHTYLNYRFGSVNKYFSKLSINTTMSLVRSYFSLTSCTYTSVSQSSQDSSVSAFYVLSSGYEKYKAFYIYITQNNFYSRSNKRDFMEARFLLQWIHVTYPMY